MSLNGRRPTKGTGSLTDSLRTCARYSWNAFRRSNRNTHVQSSLPFRSTGKGVLYVSCQCLTIGVHNRVTVCFFTVSLRSNGISTGTPAFILFSALGRGPVLKKVFKVERRTPVHMGSRDSIVHIDIGRTRMSPVVRVTTTKHQPETRNWTFRGQQPFACKGRKFGQYGK